MSKQQGRRTRHRQHQQPDGIRLHKKWLVLIGVAAALLVIGVAAFAMSDSTTTEVVVTGAPAIEVEQSFFDLGDMRFNQMARVIYEINNVGDEPLKILAHPNVQVLEGC